MALGRTSPLQPVAMVAALCALAALTTALLGAPLWIVLPVAAAAWGIALYAVNPWPVARWWRSTEAHGPGSFGVAAIARLLLAMTALVLLHQPAPDHSGWIRADGATAAAAGWVLVATLLVYSAAILPEAAVGALLNLAMPFAAHTPGLRPRDVRALPGSAGFVAGHAVLLCVFVAIGPWRTGVATPAVLVLALLAALLVLAAMIWTVRSGLFAVHRVRARHRFGNRLPHLMRQLAPRFAVHFDAPPGTAYQLAMWLPELERLGEDFVIIVRNAHSFREVAALTDRPVIYRRRLEELDQVVCDSLRAVFYVNNAVRNAHMARYPQYRHVQLNHGDSDKAPSHNPMFRLYDLDFVAGQAAIDRFPANGVWMPPQMFRIVGRPQVRGTDIAAGPISTVPEPTVLYAPTWLGFNADSRYSSLPWGVSIVQALLDRGCRVVFRPHPHAYRTPSLAAACRRIREMLDQDEQRTGRRHTHGSTAEKRMSLIDCFNASDAMVSDVSSVVVDYLYSEKPLALVAVGVAADEFVQQFPAGRAAYVIEAGSGDAGQSDGGSSARGQARNVDAVLDALLADTDLPDVRRSLKKHYLGDIPADEYFDRFVVEARAVLAGRPAHQTQTPTQE